MAKIQVQNTEVTIITYDDKDYISLTDMVRNIDNGSALIEKWLRNKNTIEFLGIWEEMYNPHFNSPEFEGIKNEAGLNRFILSVKQWVEKTNSKGLIAKAGRYGGTYAHKDIAFDAVFIDQGLPQGERLIKLNQIAIQQMKVLEKNDNSFLLK